MFINNENLLRKVTFFAILILSAALFVSFSVSAVFHILIFIPSLYFFSKALRNGKLDLSPSMLFLFLLIIVSILSVLTNLEIVDRPLWNIAKLKYFFIGLFSIWAIREVNENYVTKQQARVILNSFFLFATIATLSGLIGLYSGFNPLRMKDACHASRACGMYGMYMTYGYGISFFTFILFGIAIFREHFQDYLNKSLFWVALVVNAAGMYLSYARGPFIALIFCLPFLLLKKSKAFVVLAFTMMLALGTTAFFKSDKINEMFSSSDRLGSIKIRMSHYEAAVKAFQEKPYLGYGYRNFEPNSKKIKEKNKISFAGQGGHAHNNFLEHLASTGMIGCMLLILFHLAWLFEMYNRKDVIGYIMMPFVLYLGATGMVQYTLGDGENLFLIMFLYSLSHSIDRNKFKLEDSII